MQEKDSDGRPDDDLAAEAWANYRARNDSAVVDHFQVGPGASVLYVCLGVTAAVGCRLWGAPGSCSHAGSGTSTL